MGTFCGAAPPPPNAIDSTLNGAQGTSRYGDIVHVRYAHARMEVVAFGRMRHRERLPASRENCKSWEAGGTAVGDEAHLQQPSIGSFVQGQGKGSSGGGLCCLRSRVAMIPELFGVPTWLGAHPHLSMKPCFHPAAILTWRYCAVPFFLYRCGHFQPASITLGGISLYCARCMRVSACICASKRPSSRCISYRYTLNYNIQPPKNTHKKHEARANRVNRQPTTAPLSTGIAGSARTRACPAVHPQPHSRQPTRDTRHRAPLSRAETTHPTASPTRLGLRCS